MRTALEAAHIREEQLRTAAEQASKERDELRWRWNEDAGVWRRREAEVSLWNPPLALQLTNVVASSPNTPPHAAASSVRSGRLVSGATGLVCLFFSDVTTCALVSTFTTPSSCFLSAPTCNSASELHQRTSTCTGTACVCADAHPPLTGVCSTLWRFIFGPGSQHVTLVVWPGTVCSKLGCKTRWTTDA